MADPIRIPLRKNGVVVAHALIDAEDAAQAEHRWHLTRQGYASRKTSSPIPSERRIVLLHREILGLVHGDGMQGDHINRDRLDCRRANLRAVPLVGNAQNRGSLPGSRSQYRGVYWSAQSNRWIAKAVMNKRQIHIGVFTNEHEAGEAARRWRMENMPWAVEDLDERAA